MREGEASSRGTPVSDLDSRPRKGRKGKAKAQDYDAPIGSKRKRGIKAMSVTPSAAGDDEDEDRISVNCFLYVGLVFFLTYFVQKRRKTKTSDISPALRERMKRAFEECYDAVYDCEAEEGRTRRDLFLQLPAKKVCPQYDLTVKTSNSSYQPDISGLLSAHLQTYLHVANPKAKPKFILQNRAAI